MKSARSKLPSVSVVVPTCRRHTLLRRCLDGLLAQRIAPEAFEIIIVDDGHEDAVRELVHRVAQGIGSPSVRYVRPLRGRGPAVARNRGWRIARGALIAFTDDDTVAAPHWLAAGLRAFETDPRMIALSGQVVVPPRSPGAAPSDHERMTQGLASAEFVTANAFVRRSALEAVGGFDERFTRAWREDSDLQFRLLGLGAVGRAEDAIVVHPVREEAWGVSLRQQRNIYFDALLFKKHPRLYRSRIRRVPPWDYYAIVALSAGTPLLWTSGAPWLALAGLGAAAALVLRFAWRRLRRADRSPRHVFEMVVTSALIPFLALYWRLRGALRFRVLFL